MYAATSPDLDGQGGVYLEDCHIAEITSDADVSAGVRAYALDTQKSRRACGTLSGGTRRMRFTYAEAMTDPSYYLPLAKAAEAAGFDGFLVPDSICYPARVRRQVPVHTRR